MKHYNFSNVKLGENHWIKNEKVKENPIGFVTVNYYCLL